MIKSPESWEEAGTWAAKALWAISRIQLIGLVAGIIITLLTIYLGGFWQFRNDQQRVVWEQYQTVLNSHDEFQARLDEYSAAFEGVDVSQTITTPYRDAARSYIREVEKAGRLLPELETEIAAHIEAIARLNKYFIKPPPSDADQLEWMLYFGRFRVDLEQYVQSKEAYLNRLAEEAGAYNRFILNS